MQADHGRSEQTDANPALHYRFIITQATKKNNCKSAVPFSVHVSVASGL